MPKTVTTQPQGRKGEKTGAEAQRFKVKKDKKNENIIVSDNLEKTFLDLCAFAPLFLCPSPE